MSINDKQWWEENFGSGAWTGNMGREQTAYFAKLITAAIPPDIRKELDKSGIKIIDWGCALGQGVYEFHGAFPNADVVGYDFSETAISKAREIYPELCFRNDPIEGDESVDAIIISNTLEHFRDPLQIAREHLKHVKRYYVILVPYRQYGIDGPCDDGCHFYSFTGNTFPAVFEGFSRVYGCLIPPFQPRLWAGYQMLLIYERRSLH
jgi:SAM-dependent methyltransferase